MKTKLILLISVFGFFIVSCNSDEVKPITGEQSAMGEVGNSVSSSSIEVAGVSGISAEITALDDDGVSSYSGSATVTNPTIISILENFPECTIVGDKVTMSGIEMRSTTKGIESVSGLDPGIIVEYDAKVGDEYPIAGTQRKRKVVSRSTTDDYDYGFFMIKTIEVEEYPVATGVDKIIYHANHRFGLVGIEFVFDDGTTAKYPVYNTNEN